MTSRRNDKTLDKLLSRGFRITDDDKYNSLLSLFNTFPRFQEGGAKANPLQIKTFINKWFVELGIIYPAAAGVYAEELLDHLLPENPWEDLTISERDAIKNTTLPSKFIYNRLTALSPLYRVDSWSRLRQVWSPILPESLVLFFISDIPINPITKFIVGRSRDFMGIRGFTPKELTALGTRSDTVVSRSWLRVFDKDGSDMTTLYKAKFGDSYMERYAPTPGVFIATNISNKLPDYVRELVSLGGTVLSGSSLLKIVCGGFRPECGDLTDGPEYLREVFTMIKSSIDIRPVRELQDYDIYTIKHPKDIYALLSKHGFQWIAEWNTRGRVVFDPSYSSWLLRMVRGEEHVDVIFTNKYHDLTHRPPERPQDFIVKEFDIDVTKIWYDGQDVWAPNEKIARGIVERKMELDFHPNMAINTHKTITTMKRLFKYHCRGFSIDIRDNRSFTQFLNAFSRYFAETGLFAVRRVFNVPRSIEIENVMVKTVEQFLKSISPEKRRQIIDYNNYFINTRNDLYFSNTPIPMVPTAPQPKEFLGLETIARVWLSMYRQSREEINNLFVQYLGIGVVNIQGGYRLNWRDSFMLGESIFDAAPFVLARNGYLPADIDNKIRLVSPETQYLPDCQALFTPKAQSTEKFRGELRNFLDICNRLESEPPCKRYLEDVRPYIEKLYADVFTDDTRRLPTLNTVRGMELFTAFENMAEHVGVDHDRVYVRYAGEPGIDAGGLRKEFYINVCRQMKPLFSYLNPLGTDPRMYISNASEDQILREINTGFKEDTDYAPFTAEDLPPLYYLAGKMFADAFINNYSTELPLSRVLLLTMVSSDLGIALSSLKTAYLMERDYKDSLENLYFFDIDNPGSSEEVLENLALETYFAGESDPKFTLVRNFVTGFGSMAKVLHFFHIIPGELFSAVCSSNITREAFETYIRSSLTSFKMLYKTDEETSTTTRILGSSDPLGASLRAKLLSFLFERTEDLVPYLHNNFPERFPRTLTKNQTIVNYYQLVMEGITNLNVLDTRKEITFQFVRLSQAYAARTTQIDFHVHNCFDEVEISAAWFERADLEEWLLVSTGAFLEKKYSSA